ncbi:photosystem II protein Psb27 [Rubidibacter lacunae]|nr:photosystem II protein Psb27 [Rubidibacter lacunae]
MDIKLALRRLCVFVLAAVFAIGVLGCGIDSGSGLSGNYRQDTMTLLDNLKTLIAMSQDDAGRADLQDTVRLQINDYAARYRRDNSVAGLRSFTTMQTALNALAGYYSSPYAIGRPLPEKIEKRLNQEFAQVERALQRGA